MGKNKTVLCLVAHPDDAEFQCAGTLALLADKGWKIVIATMTPGQAGSTELGPEEISIIRRAEAANSATLLNGTYHCLESEDVFAMYDRPTLLKAIELIRNVKPTIVFTASPSDYMIDHEVVSKLAMTACLAAGIPNIKINDTTPYNTIPYLYYCDAMQGKDILGQEIKSDIYVDISSTIDIKEKMLCCHKSQRDWLLKISNVDEYVIMMKDYSMKKGGEINCDYAEGFRQHLGFSYPSENILKSELDMLVYQSF
ncbi:MAG TPA: LmbE family protein [Sphingobacteriaceae bacterium]|nr:LmbE family protein [Sphingobacteriaceae bacterium]